MLEFPGPHSVRLQIGIEVGPLEPDHSAHLVGRDLVLVDHAVQRSRNHAQVGRGTRRTEPSAEFYRLFISFMVFRHIRNTTKPRVGPVKAPRDVVGLVRPGQWQPLLVPESETRLYVVPPSDAARPVHQLNEILTAHGGTAPGFFTLPDGRQAWEVIVSNDAATLELAFIAKGWTPVQRPGDA